MKHTIKQLAVGAGAVASLVVGINTTTASAADQHQHHININAQSQSRTIIETTPNYKLPSWAIRPCPYEDSVNCYWNANARGNHNGGNKTGHSFVVRWIRPTASNHFNGITCVYYIDADYAAKHDYCS